MMPADIPAAVLEFIARRIDSVTELETLLIMCEHETRSWTVGDIAARIYVTPSLALAVLHALQRRRLVDVSADGMRYRFRAASEGERQVVMQTGIAYRAHLIPMTKLIHQKASPPVQEFARAFELKKDD
jgi:hypothetical protein